MQHPIKTNQTLRINPTFLKINEFYKNIVLPLP